MIKNHQKKFQVNQTITSKDIWMSGNPPPKNAIFGGGGANINSHLPRMVLTCYRGLTHRKFLERFEFKKSFEKVDFF